MDQYNYKIEEVIINSIPCIRLFYGYKDFMVKIEKFIKNHPNTGLILRSYFLKIDNLSEMEVLYPYGLLYEHNFGNIKDKFYYFFKSKGYLSAYKSIGFSQNIHNIYYDGYSDYDDYSDHMDYDDYSD
jgi:hypothetical protein